jgi:uncharacterized damage-inducible protein DinB
VAKKTDTPASKKSPKSASAKAPTAQDSKPSGKSTPKSSSTAVAADAGAVAPPEVFESAVPRKGRGKAPFDVGAALVAAWETHERIHEFLLESLDPAAWSALAPIGKGRTIRGVVAHIHNVRLLWLAHHAPELSLPAKLDREQATLDEARAALAASAAAIGELLKKALADQGKLAGFKPDVVGFFTYATAHEAHHRGQICLLARAVGKPLEQAQGYGLWEWRKRHDEARPEPEA